MASDLILIEIKNLLQDIKFLLEEKGAPAPMVQPAKAEENSVLDWISQQNAQAEEEPSEPVAEEGTAEVIFELLEGVEPGNFEKYIGKPLSEVEMSVLQTIASPNYRKHAEKKFPLAVIEAAERLTEEE